MRRVSIVATTLVLYVLLTLIAIKINFQQPAMAGHGWSTPLGIPYNGWGHQPYWGQPTQVGQAQTQLGEADNDNSSSLGNITNSSGGTQPPP